MTSGINILGLGRCVVGHLKNNLLSRLAHLPAEQQGLSFRHHYILSPLPCLLSNGKHLTELHTPFSNQFAPPLEDQISCLDNLTRFDVLVVEIFPGAPVYRHTRLDIYACFENYTQELADHGFRLFSIPERNGAGARQYAQHLAELVKKAKTINPQLKIILLNGEFAADRGTGVIGNPFILDLLREIKASRELANDSIKLIDAISLLAALSEKNIAFYETEFPYRYIRHTKELEAITVARDCKHASPFLRQVLLAEFCRYLTDWNLPSAGLDINAESRPSLPSRYRDRAHAFLQQHNTSLLFEAGNARLLSLYLEYSSMPDTAASTLILKECIRDFFAQRPQKAADLKTFLYHTRSLSAQIYSSADSYYLPVCQQVIGRILRLPAEGLREYYNFAILWTQNILLACNNIIDHNHRMPGELLIDHGSLLDQVACSFLNTFSPIQLIIEASRRRLPCSANHSFRGAEHNAPAW